jgi:hypothetical protein
VSFNRQIRAGATIEDHCRQCKTDRDHTVIVVDGDGVPLRVTCDYCESQHNYRGGPRMDASAPATAPAYTRAPAGEPPDTAGRAASVATGYRPPPAARPAVTAASAFPIVSDRERTAPPVTLSGDTQVDLEALLRRIIREEAGVTPVVPAARWRGGTLVLRPGTPGLQEKEIPIETFFHKIVMLRNRLRTLEQQVNASDIPEDAKLKMQSYVTGCYGSLTTFNVLFADPDDQFKGSGD